jgi:Glycine/D-amino acid oxidases (deaminating)
MSVQSPDILILGAGILGSSCAWHLSQKGGGEIAVIDLDLAGTYSSSELNAGGVRATWWHPINMDLSQESIRFYETIAPEVQFFQKGYLFLYGPSKWKIALSRKPNYEAKKIPVQYLEAGQISEFLPEFENHKGISGATFSPKDGLIDPHLLREFYREGAKRRGVHFFDHTYAEKVVPARRRISELWVRQASAPLQEEVLEGVLTQHRVPSAEKWKNEIFRPKILLNCTGAWLPITSGYYGDPLPIQAVRRQISLFSSHQEDFSDRGMIVDSSGLYMHAEGSHTGLILAGYSNRDEKPGYHFEYDGERFFDRKIWLRLYRRGNRKYFEAVKHVRGWAGLYAVSPDRTGILGRVEPYENLFELGAATGRGVMQSYALGRAMAELILEEKFSALDAAPLSRKRFQNEAFLPENLDI